MVFAVAFVIIDRRAAAPLLPRQLTGDRRLRQGALGGFLNTATTSSVITLLTLYLQNTLHRSPLQAAATLLPFSLAVIAGSSLSVSLQRRVRPQWAVAAGLAMIAAADIALIPSARSAWAVPLCAAGAGTGIGLSSVAATGLGTDVEVRWRGGASGIINTAAQLGTALGIAVLLLVAAATSGVPARRASRRVRRGPSARQWPPPRATRFALAARAQQPAPAEACGSQLQPAARLGSAAEGTEWEAADAGGRRERPRPPQAPRRTGGSRGMARSSYSYGGRAAK